MSKRFRGSYRESRENYLGNYDQQGVAEYEAWISQLTQEDHQACMDDLTRGMQFSAGMRVLDAGAGTGALTSTLQLIDGLAITALEPSPAMISVLKCKPELANVRCVEGFCDHHSDRSLFEFGAFDVIASRQLANCLFDPIAAFQNWWHWLADGGRIVLTDGFYDRSSWTGQWENVVDQLPLSACQSMATVPYLMEYCGFRIDFVDEMKITNTMASTRTKRYLVVATKTLPIDRDDRTL